MTTTQGDHYSVHIGGDLTGSVVVGHGNHVESHHVPAPQSSADGGTRAPASQTNTARDRGTVYAVTDGDMHVHQYSAPPTSDT
ncbi:hypothetical protein [Streptomyces marincola]|uniref:hypothetical protein n=1 Tax=Streptomyces marincola TaxID=2878388 RepID=UPI001CF2C309|nr:hypothetical protein [Streptomyces marincola]UCM91264.1 hypothetical protein LC193_26805 [Streptomyces marincola]